MQMKPRAIVFLASAAFALAAFVPAEAIGLRIEPVKLILTAKPGAKTGGAIRVTNPTSFPVRPTAVLYDFDIDEQGRFSSKNPGSTPSTLAQWIKFNPRQFTLDPQSQQLVRFSTSVPRGAAPGERRAVIFFEQRTDAPQTTGATITSQVGVVVYVAVEPVRRTFEVTGVAAMRDTLGAIQVNVVAAATGNAHCRPKGFFKLYDSAGRQVDGNDFPEGVVLPGNKLKMQSHGKTPSLKPGKYRLYVEVAAESKSRVFRRDYDITLQ